MGKRVVIFLAPAVVGALLVASLVNQASAVDVARPVAIEIEKLEEHGTLVLVDGNIRCLAGIWVPAPYASKGQAPAWRSAWHGIIEDGLFFRRDEQPLEHDRYGCPVARLVTEDGASLEQALVKAGWAAVDPSSMTGDEHEIDAMLAVEDKARRDGRGIWKHAAAWPKKADDVSTEIGLRQIVEGRVRRVSENDRYLYLNFGADWRTDFTVRLGQKMISSVGLDAAAFDGKRLRVRGVLQESRGPLIDISSLQQIEFLP